MNSYERFRGVVQGGKADGVPVAPYMGNYGASIAGVSISDYCRSGRVMSDAQYQAWEMVGQDAVVPQSDNYYIAEGFGCEVVHHPNGTPTLRTPALASLDGADDLRLPDPQNDGRMPVYLEAIERLSARLKGEVIIRAPGTGPFSLASYLLGTSEFIMRLSMLTVEPDPKAEAQLRKLMHLSTRALIDWSKAAIDAGADTVQAGDSLASLDMISPQMYAEWVYPYEVEYFSEINAYRPEELVGSILHICGDTTKILHLMADTGASIVEIDSKVNMADAARIVDGRACLLGNIEPSAILLQGTSAQVETASKHAIADSRGTPFILGSGCEVPPATPLDNLRTMVSTARSWDLRR